MRKTYREVISYRRAFQLKTPGQAFPNKSTKYHYTQSLHLRVMSLTRKDISFVLKEAGVVNEQSDGSEPFHLACRKKIKLLLPSYKNLSQENNSKGL